METLTGYVQSVLFYNENNHYTIARLRLDAKKDELIVIVGYFDLPKKQELCRFIGDFTDHPKYGRQFAVEAYEKIMPDGEEAVIRFLSSSLFPGVGTHAAQKVIDQLGNDCLRRIQEDPSLLEKVALKPELRDVIRQGILNSTRLNEAIKLFVGHGIQLKYLLKMDAIYKDKLIETVLTNPYQLVRDIDGITFQTADRIAKSFGILEEDPRRIQALVIYLSNQICFQTQNTYTSKEELFAHCYRMVSNLGESALEEAFNELQSQHELIVEENRIYPHVLYEAENGIADYLVPYIKQHQVEVDSVLVLSKIAEVEAQLGITYNQDQIAAILTCMNEGITLLTGGPGTGKTTVVNAIIRIYEQLFPEGTISLVAPTGRSAKRMTDLTGKMATTIHRFLKWDLETNHFSKDENDPIFGDFLIIDEFSMVDCQLFFHLLKATFPFSKILVIGDDEQLPPVSPGDVLRDLLELQIIPTVRLVQIHRQSESSGIIPLAYQVRRGEVTPSLFGADDVSFYPCVASEVTHLTLSLVKQMVEKGYNQQEIQVLAPMYDGVAGIHNINNILREYFNPQSIGKKEIMIGRAIYREGDKILQLKNQPDDDVYNGDIGMLEEVIRKDEDFHKQDRLIINFDENLVTYTAADFANITHAYCISVHKSQGSEYPLVIMPILRDYSRLLRRKLIYTGITRAKKELLLLGDFNAFQYGVSKVESTKRQTTLQVRIKEKITKI